jgi:nicotinamide-nucleotide amidase
VSADPLVEQLLDALRARGWKLAVAESCTGGELSARVSALAGSSDVFVGGVIPYADTSKTALLGVSPSLIAEHGAVSAEVAAALARGVRSALEADVGVGITGIAGPGGARPNKPVGLVFIAISGPAGDPTPRRDVWQGNRASNREHSVTRAIESLVQYAAPP